MTVRAEAEGGRRAVPGHERAHPGQVDDAHGGGVRREGEQGTLFSAVVRFKFVT